MTETNRNLLVGTFVVMSFVVLGILMVLFGEAPSWLGGSEWTLRITNVNGLSGLDEGSPVILNGVEIGRVKRLEFEDPSRPHQGVVIVAGIKKQYQVPRDARARVYGATLGFGTGHIEVFCAPQSVAEPLDKEFAVIPGEMRSVIGDLVSGDLVRSIESAVESIGALAASAKPVADNLAEMTAPRKIVDGDSPEAGDGKTLPNLTTAIARIDTLSANLNKLVGDQQVQADVKTALSELRRASEDLRETMGVFKEEAQRTSDNLNTGINSTEQHLSASFAKLNTTLEDIDGGMKTLAQLLLRVENGEGTAGRFMRDERLYEAAVLSLERIAELAGTLQRIFGKAESDGYITIGQHTPVGTITVDMPLDEVARRVRTKLGLADDS